MKLSKPFHAFIGLLAGMAISGSVFSAPVLQGTTNASATLGNSALPSVTIDFGLAGYDFVTLDIFVDYTPSQLRFNAAPSLLNLPAGLLLSGFDDNTALGQYTASYDVGLDPAIRLDGSHIFNFSFTVLSGLPTGQASDAHVRFAFGADNGDLDQLGNLNGRFQEPAEDLKLTVTHRSSTGVPIPEPATGLLMLSALMALSLMRRYHTVAVKT